MSLSRTVVGVEGVRDKPKKKMAGVRPAKCKTGDEGRLLLGYGAAKLVARSSNNQKTKQLSRKKKNPQYKSYPETTYSS